ncbi:MAG: TIGR01459 family HAD-type hydrolase [Pseudomonadota bacterium]|nr:TIGR01459 family HAD-type hydrolase [Pseudomonadota bacterium]
MTDAAAGSFPRLLPGLSAIAGRYDGLLCDVWGVVHNGVAAHADAADALTHFRARHGPVLLLSNAPRPGDAVMRQLDGFGVPREAYDGVVTSGDITRELLAERPDAAVFRLGPERDAGLFEGLDLRFVEPEDAEFAVVTGLLDDEAETPQDYAPLLERLLARRLPLVCANPDLVVERGNRLIYCAGAIAALYADMGGEVVNMGKPHRPVYEASVARMALMLGRAPEPERLLAIGDGPKTDIRGAAGFGIDALFIAGGIHGAELIRDGRLDMARVGDVLVAEGVPAIWVQVHLAW